MVTFLFSNQDLSSDGIINCQGDANGGNGKRPSNIDIPCVVSIGKILQVIFKVCSYFIEKVTTNVFS